MADTRDLQREPLTIALTGDVMLGRDVDEAIERHGYGYPWGDVLPVLRRADLRLINLECALTAELTPWRDRHGQYGELCRVQPGLATDVPAASPRGAN